MLKLFCVNFNAKTHFNFQENEISFGILKLTNPLLKTGMAL